jgi:hypothetical protein
MIFVQGKMYLPDDYQPEVFDPVTKTWSNWTLPITPGANVINLFIAVNKKFS